MSTRERKSADTKTVERKSADVNLFQDDWDYSVSERNMLSLPQELKEELMSQDLDWRFISALQFREKGNIHHNQWRPYNVTQKAPYARMQGVTAEGVLQRGDLILAVRPKKLSQVYRARLEEKNNAYKGYNKEKAEELRSLARESGIDKATKIHEGYSDN